MTCCHKTRPARDRLLAGAVFCALIAQMALPALHALGAGSTVSRAAQSAPPAFHAASVQQGTAHDTASCFVCQSLLRTSPVATSSGAFQQACLERTTAPCAAPVCAPSRAVPSGHPPRAPPAAILA